MPTIPKQLLVLASVLYAGLLTAAPAPLQPLSRAQRQELAAEVLADRDMAEVLEKARALLRTGLTAGSGYGEVWIRDLNTSIEVSLEVNPPGQLRGALLRFLSFQGANGEVPDGYIPREKASVGYQYRTSPLAPGFLAHKNTVETDQESSLVLAVRKFIAITGERTILREGVDGRTVIERLDLALQYVLNERFDRGKGLVWGATTADWGDVQPEHEWGVEFDATSHRACDIYDNALYLSAIDALLEMLPPESPRAGHWRQIHRSLKRRVRTQLWDSRRQKFIPHLYLAGSPFPSDFDESVVYYHGGTAVAVEAGLLSRAEIAASLESMRRNVRAAGAASIGLTLQPAYPKGFFKNPGMGPYSYQNGGDWCWFGGRMVQQLARNGFVREAYEELRPMVVRVRVHGDFREWWSVDNQPRGSRQFRGSAGVLGRAIEMLRAWAEAEQSTGRSP
ncbi:MAG TPA: hypothetical protein DCM86_19455 [Verrucomicrobiales bacterium]|nr:hypothetical protein [Verrucomicrobiales bacterium]